MKKNLINETIIDKDKVYESLGIVFTKNILSGLGYEIRVIDKNNFDQKEVRLLRKSYGDMFITKKTENKTINKSVKIITKEIYDGNVPYEKYSTYNPDNNAHREGWGESLTDCDFIHYIFINFRDDRDFMSWERAAPTTRISSLLVPMKHLKSFLFETNSIIYPSEEKINDYQLLSRRKVNSQKQEVLSYDRQIPIKDILKNVKNSSEYNLSRSFNIFHLEKCLFDSKIHNNIELFKKEIENIEFSSKKILTMNTYEKMQYGKFICHWYNSELPISEWDFFDKYSIEQKSSSNVDTKTKHFSSKKFNKIICRQAMREFKIFS
jgi:hypothetical protein